MEKKLSLKVLAEELKELRDNEYELQVDVDKNVKYWIRQLERQLINLEKWLHKLQAQILEIDSKIDLLSRGDLDRCAMCGKVIFKKHWIGEIRRGGDRVFSIRRWKDIELRDTLEICEKCAEYNEGKLAAWYYQRMISEGEGRV